MSLRRIGNAAAALALLVSVPATAVASVRPGSAVPTAAAASAVSSSAQGYSGRAVTPWPAYALIALTIAVGVWIAVDDDDDGKSFPISRG